MQLEALGVSEDWKSEKCWVRNDQNQRDSREFLSCFNMMRTLEWQGSDVLYKTKPCDPHHNPSATSCPSSQHLATSGSLRAFVGSFFQTDQPMVARSANTTSSSSLFFFFKPLSGEENWGSDTCHVKIDSSYIHIFDPWKFHDFVFKTLLLWSKSPLSWHGE